MHAVNPPGTKVANSMLKAAGVLKDGRGTHVFHGGELTAAAKARSAEKRKAYVIVMHSDYERSMREELERLGTP